MKKVVFPFHALLAERELSWIVPQLAHSTAAQMLAPARREGREVKNGDEQQERDSLPVLLPASMHVKLWL